MRPGMLKSQFDALEDPLGALVADVRLSPEEIVEEIITSIQSKGEK